MYDSLNNKRILITGGTGSFGNEVVKRLLDEYDNIEIIVFSRDEKKQFDMRNDFKSNKLKFIIGDVRDRNSVFNVMKGLIMYFMPPHLNRFQPVGFSLTRRYRRTSSEHIMYWKPLNFMA